MSKPALLTATLFTLSLGVALPGNAADTPLDVIRGAAPSTSDGAVQLARKSKQKARKEKEAAEAAAAEAARVAAEEEARLAAEAAAKQAEEEQKAKLAAEETARQAAAADAQKRAALAQQNAVEARGLDARARRLSDEIARAIKRLPGDHRDHSFAVVPFAENDEESKSRRLGLVVSDMILTNLARDHRINLIERGRLSVVLEEQAFEATGAVDPAKAAEVGKLLGARGLVVGEVTDTGEAFRIGARVLDMETGGILAASEATLPKEELIAFSADAVVLRSKAGGFFRSLVAPGWGQIYNREPVKAGIVAGGVGALALTTAVVTTTALLTHNAYTTFTPDSLPEGVSATHDNVSKTVVGLRDSANLQYTAAGVLLGLTASAWIVGALDAYLSGTDVDTLDDALAAN